MQVNLLHHADAFADLKAAFDPRGNARYAAGFLKRLHGKTRSWPQAVAHYHSATPELGQRYLAKVLQLWNAPETGKTVVAARAKGTWTRAPKTDVAAWRAERIAEYLKRRARRGRGRL